jgi:hypothetical protein
LRAWSRLAASGDAQCKYDRANAQHVPHRLATSATIPHRPKIAFWGTFCSLVSFWGYRRAPLPGRRADTEATMHGLIYLVGLIVVVLFILSLLGLR